MDAFKESEILVAVGPRIGTLAVSLVKQKRTHESKSIHTKRKCMRWLGSKQGYKGLLFAIGPRQHAVTMHFIIDVGPDVSKRNRLIRI